jgi:hypothetical protein
MDSIIRRFVKIGAKVVYHARRYYVHVASAFLSPVTIASFSPEPRPTGWVGSELLTAGIEVCPQTTQIGLIGIFLAVFDFGISFNLWTFGMPSDVSDGIRLGNAVRGSLTVKLTRYSGSD